MSLMTALGAITGYQYAVREHGCRVCECLNAPCPYCPALNAADKIWDEAYKIGKESCPDDVMLMPMRNGCFNTTKTITVPVEMCVQIYAPVGDSQQFRLWERNTTDESVSPCQFELNRCPKTIGELRKDILDAGIGPGEHLSYELGYEMNCVSNIFGNGYNCCYNTSDGSLFTNGMCRIKEVVPQNNIDWEMCNGAVKLCYNNGTEEHCYSCLEGKWIE